VLYADGVEGGAGPFPPLDDDELAASGSSCVRLAGGSRPTICVKLPAHLARPARHGLGSVLSRSRRMKLQALVHANGTRFFGRTHEAKVHAILELWMGSTSLCNMEG